MDALPPDSDPIHDPARLQALAASGLLTDAPEAFDRLTRLVRSMLDVPVALATLVDTERQVFASQKGVGEPWRSAGETPLSHSFCKHVVERGGMLAVEDARETPLVRENRAVSELAVVAYLGVPIRAPGGAVLGALCAIDHTTRAWREEEVRGLQDLAALAEEAVALRVAQRRLARISDALTDSTPAPDRPRPV